MREEDTFKIVCDGVFPNADRIHPLMQRPLLAAYEKIKNDSDVIEFIVFGSSVTKHCRTGSDLDVYVELKKEKKMREIMDLNALHCDLDFWTNFTASDALKEEILKTGVRIK